MMKLGATWIRDNSRSLPRWRAEAVFMSSWSIRDLQPVLEEEHEEEEVREEESIEDVRSTRKRRCRKGRRRAKRRGRRR